MLCINFGISERAEMCATVSPMPADIDIVKLHALMLLRDPPLSNQILKRFIESRVASVAKLAGNFLRLRHSR